MIISIQQRTDSSIDLFSRLNNIERRFMGAPMTPLTRNYVVMLISELLSELEEDGAIFLMNGVEPIHRANLEIVTDVDMEGHRLSISFIPRQIG
jgi:hypothetical protein